MPIFEYTCEQHHKTDKLCKSDEEAPTEIECPQCQQPAVRVPISGSNFVLKGKWFKHGY